MIFDHYIWTLLLVIFPSTLLYQAQATNFLGKHIRLWSAASLLTHLPPIPVDAGSNPTHIGTSRISYVSNDVKTTIGSADSDMLQ